MRSVASQPVSILPRHRRAATKQTEARIKILRQDGRPAVGARVGAHGLSRYNFGMQLPDDVVDRIAVETDAEGTANVRAVPQEEISSIRVTTAEWEIQEVDVRLQRFALPAIRLRAAGRVKGRIVAEDPAAVRGATVELYTYTRKIDSKHPRVTGQARVRSDQFTVSSQKPVKLALRFERLCVVL